jgi:hypothetical protein
MGMKAKNVRRGRNSLLRFGPECGYNLIVDEAYWFCGEGRARG